MCFPIIQEERKTDKIEKKVSLCFYTSELTYRLNMNLKDFYVIKGTGMNIIPKSV